MSNIHTPKRFLSFEEKLTNTVSKALPPLGIHLKPKSSKLKDFVSRVLGFKDYNTYKALNTNINTITFLHHFHSMSNIYENENNIKSPRDTLINSIVFQHENDAYEHFKLYGLPELDSSTYERMFDYMTQDEYGCLRDDFDETYNNQLSVLTQSKLSSSQIFNIYLRVRDVKKESNSQFFGYKNDEYYEIISMPLSLVDTDLESYDGNNHHGIKGHFIL